MIRHAFADQAINRVTATTMFVNAQLRRVMEKRGMRHVRTWREEFADPLPGTEHGEVEYAITREEWFAMSRDQQPVLQSDNTCPIRGAMVTETMHKDTCQFFWKCPVCGDVIRLKEGDCCVYCSCGTVPCPPIQLGECRG